MTRKDGGGKLGWATYLLSYLRHAARSEAVSSFVVCFCVFSWYPWSLKRTLSSQISESPSHKEIWERMAVKVGSLLNEESPQVHVWDGINLKSSSVQFSHSIMSNSLRPQGLQHARPPCPSPTPGACSDSCPSNRWCHSTISSYVIPFSSCLQSFPALGSFPMSQFFQSGGQSIGVLKSRLLCFLCMEV